MKKFLHNASQYKITGMLRIVGPNDRFLGPGRIELLERIAETGSINQAAKQMEMSYKKAWEMVQSMNQQVAIPLVITQTGGEKGGGANLSDEALIIIQLYKDLQQRFSSFLEVETERLLNS